MPGLNRPNKIIVHHTGGTDAQPLADSSKATAQDIDAWHKLRWPGFTSLVYKNDKGKFYHTGYHFVIEKDGKIVPCRAMNEEGAHCIGQNTSSIGVNLAGNFDLTLPTQAQKNSFKKVFKLIQAAYPNITEHDIYPHRRYATKTCYGNNLSDTYFTELLKPTNDEEVLKVLRERIVQLTSQLKSLISKKRMSKRERNV